MKTLSVKAEFLNRGRELASFVRFLKTDGARSILYVYGVAGIGKSALLNQMRIVARKRSWSVLEVDLETSRTELDILSRLSSSCPSVDFAEFTKALEVLGSIWTKVTRLELGRGSKAGQFTRDFAVTAGAAAMMGAVGGFPGVILGGAAGAAVGPIAEKGIEAVSGRVHRKGLLSGEAALVADAGRALTEAFLRDLRVLSEHHCILLTVDSYERARRLEAWLRLDFFGPGLHGLANVRVVIAGRDPLSYEWSKVKAGVESVELMPLHRKNALALVKRSGVTDEVATDRILRGAEGNPLLLETLCGSFVGVAGGSNLFEEGIDGAIARHVEILLDHLDERLRTLVEAAAVPRFFDFDLLNALLNGHLEYPEYERLLHISLVEERGQGTGSIRFKERGEIASRLQQRSPKTYKAYHLRARDYYVEQARFPGKPVDVGACIEAFYHARLVEAREGIQLYLRFFDSLSSPLNPMACDALLEELEGAVEEGSYSQEYLLYFEARRLQASNLWEEAKTLFREISAGRDVDQVARALALRDLGALEFHQGYVDRACERFQEAHRIFQKERPPLSLGRMLNDLGRVSRRMGRKDLAMAYHRTVLEAPDQPDQSQCEDVIAAHRCLSRLYRDTGLWHEAVEECKRSLECARLSGRLESEGIGQLRLAELYCYLGLWQDALVAVELALPLISASENDHARAAAFEISGRIQFWNRMEDEAQSHLVSALWLFRRLGADIGQSLAEIDLARLYFLIELPDRGELYAGLALERARRIGDPDLQGLSKLALGDILRSKGQWRRAADLYEAAIEHFSRSGNLYRKLDSFLGLAVCRCHLLSASKFEVALGKENWLALQVYTDLRARALCYAGAFGVLEEGSDLEQRLREGLEAARSFSRTLESQIRSELARWSDSIAALNGDQEQTVLRSEGKEFGGGSGDLLAEWKLDGDSGELRRRVGVQRFDITRARPFVLLHHGLSSARARGLIQGRMESQLTEEGRAGVREELEYIRSSILSRGLPFTNIVVLSSPAYRAIETALLVCDALASVAGVHPNIHVRQGLANIALGEWEGREKEEVKSSGGWTALSGGRNFLVKAAGCSSDRSPGESLWDVMARSIPVLREAILNRGTDCTIAVGHKMSVLVPGVLLADSSVLLDADGVVNWRRLEVKSGGAILLIEGRIHVRET